MHETTNKEAVEQLAQRIDQNLISRNVEEQLNKTSP